MSRLIIELEGSAFGEPRYVCYRTGCGLMGNGPSAEMALADFEDKENAQRPTAAERDINDQIQEALADERY